MEAVTSEHWPWKRAKLFSHFDDVNEISHMLHLLLKKYGRKQKAATGQRVISSDGRGQQQQLLLIHCCPHTTSKQLFNLHFATF